MRDRYLEPPDPEEPDPQHQEDADELYMAYEALSDEARALFLETLDYWRYR